MDYSDNDSDPQMEENSEEEDANQYDSEEDDEEAEERPRKKRATTTRNYFVDDEVEEDSEEEETDFVDTSVKDRPSSYGKEYYSRRRGPNFAEANDEQMREMARRYSRYDEQQYDEEEDDTRGSTIPRREPLNTDPRIWMLTCRKPGQEQSVVCQIMERCFERRQTENPLKIMSAFCADHIKGHIFVEAFQADDVREAVANIISFQPGLASTFKTPVIPAKERISLLTVPRTSAILEPGAWVRCKRGLYKGDLAQVYRVDESEGKVWVKIIPRLNYEAIAGDLEAGNKRKRSNRPPPRFYSREEIINAGGDFDLQQNHRDSILGESFDLFKKERYKDGFLYKAIKLTSLDTNVTPSLEELKNFQTHSADDGLADRGMSATLNAPVAATSKPTLLPGDTIEVISGNLKHVQGTVLEVKDNQVSFQPKMSGFDGAVREEITNIRKHLNEGQNVEVIEGRYKGESGLITSVEGDTVTIYSHSSEQTYKLRIADVKVSTSSGKERVKLGKYVLHDLVSVGQNAVGVVVKVELDSFRVLETTGLVKRVALSEMGEKRRSATSFDKLRNQLTARDEVTVVEGVHKGKEGTIKYVIHHHLFIHSPGMIENGGIFVVPSSCVVAAGRDRMHMPQYGNNNFAPHSPFIGGDSNRGGRGGRGRGGRGGRGGRNDPLIGRKIKVTKGTYKGYTAIVKEATEKNVRAELISKSKIIPLPRGDFREIQQTNQHDRSHVAMGSGQTPMFGDRTPMVGDRTPMIGDRTPMIGDRTPMIGDRTPMLHGDRTPGIGDRTPARDASPPYGYSSTSDWSTDHTHTEPSFTPHTPGVYDTTSPYGQTGTPNDMVYPSTPGGFAIPTPAPYGHAVESPYNTATPDAYPATPATPGLMNPQTPGFGDSYGSMDYSYGGDSYSSTLATGIEVRVMEDYSAELAGELGYVLELGGNTLVRMRSGQTVNIPPRFLEATVPQKKDRIKILSGEYKNQLGTMSSINNQEACVTMDDRSNDMLILNINSLGKYVA